MDAHIRSFEAGGTTIGGAINRGDREILRGGVVCQKKKPIIRTWERRVIKIEGRSLNFYNHPDDILGDTSGLARKIISVFREGSSDAADDPPPRGSSIPDVVGYNITSDPDINNITLTKPGKDDVEVSFFTPEHYRVFLETLINLTWPINSHYLLVPDMDNPLGKTLNYTGALGDPREDEIKYMRQSLQIPVEISIEEIADGVSKINNVVIKTLNAEYHEGEIGNAHLETLLTCELTRRASDENVGAHYLTHVSVNDNGGDVKRVYLFTEYLPIIAQDHDQDQILKFATKISRTSLVFHPDFWFENICITESGELRAIDWDGAMYKAKQGANGSSIEGMMDLYKSTIMIGGSRRKKTKKNKTKRNQAKKRRSKKRRSKKRRSKKRRSKKRRHYNPNAVI